MQLTKEQIEKPLGVLNAGDALIGLQMVSRLHRAGAIMDNELATVGVFRNRLVEALQEATGINYDEAMAAEAQAAQRAAQSASAAPAAPANDAPANDTPVGDQ